jgi:transposase
LTLSAPQATWLFFRKQEDLKEEELAYLRLLRQASPPVEATYQLVNTFLQMVRERTGEQLDTWLGAVQASHLKAFQSFVTGVLQDKDAVLAGLTLPWSNGPLEGNVNRLKLILSLLKHLIPIHRFDDRRCWWLRLLHLLFLHGLLHLL